MKDKIIYFWLAGFYVKKSGLPSSCSYTALSTVWGALARSQDAVCIAPAAAAATAAGCCLVLALLLLPPPGSGVIYAHCSACSTPTSCLSITGRGERGSAPARDGERARDLQGSGLVERRRAHPPPPGPGPARQDPLEKAEVERAGSRTWPGKGHRGAGTGSGVGGISRDAELAWQSEITTGRACERAIGRRGRGKRRAAAEAAPGGGGEGRECARSAETGRGGGERDLVAGRGVGDTTTAPLSREEAGARLSRCALAGSRCVSNFKPHSACWKTSA